MSEEKKDPQTEVQEAWNDFQARIGAIKADAIDAVGDAAEKVVETVDGVLEATQAKLQELKKAIDAKTEKDKAE